LSKKRNLKVLIVSDMEGISGIDDWHQIFYGYKEFEVGRKNVTEDVNAAIRGLRTAGATEIRVVDNHGSSGPNKNIIPEKLEKNVKLYQDGPVYKRLKQAADKTIAAAVFVGFHAMAETKDGFLRHTITLDPRIKINGKPVGETTISAYTLGEYGIPVIMATGDQALVREASAFLPEIETVKVKTSFDCKTTECLPLSRTSKLIEIAAKRALSRIDEFKPTRIIKPVRLKVSFAKKEQAELCETIPRAKRNTENTISYTAEDWNEAQQLIRTAITLSSDVTTSSLFKKLTKLEGSEKAMYEWVEDIAKEWLS
jgi:D-amino peptidase